MAFLFAAALLALLCPSPARALSLRASARTSSASSLSSSAPQELQPQPGMRLPLVCEDRCTLACAQEWYFATNAKGFKCDGGRDSPGTLGHGDLKWGCLHGCALACVGNDGEETLPYQMCLPRCHKDLSETCDIVGCSKGCRIGNEKEFQLIAPLHFEAGLPMAGMEAAAVTQPEERRNYARLSHYDSGEGAGVGGRTTSSGKKGKTGVLGDSSSESSSDSSSESGDSSGGGSAYCDDATTEWDAESKSCVPKKEGGVNPADFCGEATKWDAAKQKCVVGSPDDGAKGATCCAGKDGAPGAKGTTGEPGAAGKDGEDGKDGGGGGARGGDGPPGKDGPPGQDGQDGKDGKDGGGGGGGGGGGPPGPTGRPGPPGPPGKNGDAGSQY